MEISASRFTTWYRLSGRDWRGSMVLLPVCLYFVVKHPEYTMMDNVDLIIHEAGHFFAMPFGTFIMFAGGTLMQMILPSFLAWYFYHNDYRFGAQVSLFWLGHNLLNISVYAADAGTRALPLLGGDSSRHDWWNMLGRLDLLEYDHVIGGAFFVGALVVFALCLALPRWMWTEA